LASLFGVSWSHTYRHTVGLLWTSDQPVAETSTFTGQHNVWTQQTNIHAPSGIRTPATKLPQTYTLDRAATGIGISTFTVLHLFCHITLKIWNIYLPDLCLPRVRSRLRNVLPPSTTFTYRSPTFADRSPWHWV
jgi:hypothetical protein